MKSVTWENMLLSVNGMVRLAKLFFQLCPEGFYFLPRRVSQSRLESTFGWIRQLNGGCRHPTHVQFRALHARVRMMMSSKQGAKMKQCKVNDEVSDGTDVDEFR